MPDVRHRNESAWLLPNDGSRINHRLRADMRETWAVYWTAEASNARIVATTLMVTTRVLPWLLRNRLGVISLVKCDAGSVMAG